MRSLLALLFFLLLFSSSSAHATHWFTCEGERGDAVISVSMMVGGVSEEWFYLDGEVEVEIIRGKDEIFWTLPKRFITESWLSEDYVFLRLEEFDEQRSYLLVQYSHDPLPGKNSTIEFITMDDKIIVQEEVACSL